MYTHSRTALGEYDGLFDIIAAPFKAAYSVGKSAVQTAAKVAPVVAPLIPGVGPLAAGAITIGSQLISGGGSAAPASAGPSPMQSGEAMLASVNRRLAASSPGGALQVVDQSGVVPQRMGASSGTVGGIPTPLLYGSLALAALLLLKDRR